MASKSAANKNFVTSSPLQPNGSNGASINEDSDRDEFNDTLERVNYLLDRCPIRPLSSSKWAKRKQLLHDYAYEIIQQEATSILKDSFSCNDLSVSINTNMAKATIFEESISNEAINLSPSHYSTAYHPLDLLRVESELKAIGCVKPTRYKEIKRSYLLNELAMGRKPSRKTLKRSISVDQFI